MLLHSLMPSHYHRNICHYYDHIFLSPVFPKLLPPLYAPIVLDSSDHVVQMSEVFNIIFLPIKIVPRFLSPVSTSLAFLRLRTSMIHIFQLSSNTLTLPPYHKLNASYIAGSCGGCEECSTALQLFLSALCMPCYYTSLAWEWRWCTASPYNFFLLK